MTIENPADMQSPEHILLCVSGMTPAIITETFYSLARLRHPAFIPDRVIVITTGLGRDKIQQELFDTPRFRQMCEANDWNPDCFTPDNVLTTVDSEGHPLPDIRTPKQFNDFANVMMKQVKELVDPRRKRRPTISRPRRSDPRRSNPACGYRRPRHDPSGKRSRVRPGPRPCAGILRPSRWKPRTKRRRWPRRWR